MQLIKEFPTLTLFQIALQSSRHNTITRSGGTLHWQFICFPAPAVYQFIRLCHTHTHSDCPPFSMVRRGAHKDFSIMKKNAQLTGGHLSLATACGSNSSSRRRQPAAGLPPSNLIEFNICRCILYIGLCSYTTYADQLSEPR